MIKKNLKNTKQWESKIKNKYKIYSNPTKCLIQRPFLFVWSTEEIVGNKILLLIMFWHVPIFFFLFLTIKIQLQSFLPSFISPPCGAAAEWSRPAVGCARGRKFTRCACGRVTLCVVGCFVGRGCRWGWGSSTGLGVYVVTSAGVTSEDRSWSQMAKQRQGVAVSFTEPAVRACVCVCVAIGMKETPWGQWRCGGGGIIQEIN